MRSILCAFLFLAACDRAGTSIASEYPSEVSALAVDGGEGVPFLVGKDLRPVWRFDGAPAPRKLETFSLRDQQNHVIDTALLKGRVAIVSFFYTMCPGICPMTTRNLSVVQEKFRGDDRVVMLSLSINPSEDTPEKLQTFARSHKIDSHRWRLATGSRDQIYKIARESFGEDTFSLRENEKKPVKMEDFLHTEKVYLLDFEQRLRGVYQGRMPSSLNELIEDAETLLQ